MRRLPVCATWVLAILSVTIASSPEGVRAGPTCTPTLLQTQSATAVPTQLVQIPQFNPALGQLCYAVVRITASYDALIKVENNVNTGSIITVTATETVNVDLPAFLTPLNDITNADETFTDFQMVTAWDGGPMFSFVGSDTAAFGFEPTNPRVVQLASGAYDAMDAGFGNFTGVGNLPEGFNVTGMSDFSVNSNAGDYNAQATLRMNVVVEVEYHYVPEPATLLPLLGAMFIVRRPKRRR